jgi:hypothetical protein
MNASRIAVVVLAFACAGLAVATVTSRRHARELESRVRHAAAATPVAAASGLPATETTAAMDGRDEPGNAAALLAENLRLKEQIDALSSAQAGLAGLPVAATPSTNRVSYMERVRQEDPERYRQLVEQREQRHRQTEQWYQDQFAALDDRAQAATSKEEVDLVTQIADALDRVQQLREGWRAVRDLPEDQRSAAVEQLRAESREAYATLNTLREQDRQFQLQQLASQIGYRDVAGLAQFTEAVQQIYRNTEYTPPRGSGGGRGPSSTPTTPAQP